MRTESIAIIAILALGFMFLSAAYVMADDEDQARECQRDDCQYEDCEGDECGYASGSECDPGQGCGRAVESCGTGLGCQVSAGWFR